MEERNIGVKLHHWPKREMNTGMKKEICSNTFQNFSCKIYTKLMEDYNIESGHNKVLQNSEMPEEVCACVDAKGVEVAATALSDGSIYQFRPDFIGDSNFLSELLPIRGRKLAMGLCKGERVYLFAIRDNRLYYTCETKPGSNRFEEEREAALPCSLSDRVIEKVIVKGLGDGLAVGLVLKRSDGAWDFASSFWKDGKSEFTVHFFHKYSGHFFFTGDSYNNLAIVSIGEYYVRLVVSTQTAVTFKVNGWDQILDIQWTAWRDGADAVYALLREGDLVWLAEATEDEMSRSISFTKLISQVGLTGITLSLCCSEKGSELHIAAMGDRTLYHAIAYKKTGARRADYGQFIPIAGAVKAASYVSDTTERVSLYIVKEGERRLLQRRYNRFTGEYMESIMFLPSLAKSAVRKNKCYSSEITLADQYGAPIPNQYIAIRAGDTTYLETPSGQRQIGRDALLYLRTDLMGKITVRQQVESLNANLLYLFIPDLMEEGKVIALNQMQCLQQTLKNLTADQLKNAKVSDGYLLPEDIRKSDSKIKEVLNPIKEAMSQLPDPGALYAVGAWLVSEDDLNSVELLGEPDREEDGGLGLFNRSLGDLCWGARDDILQIHDAAVSQGELILEIIMNGVKKIYRFTVRSISQIFDFVEMVFKKIKRGFSALFEWLGFLFDWNDILRCKRAIRHAFTNQTKYYVKNAVSWQSMFSSRIDELKEGTDQSLKKLADRLQGGSFFEYAKAEEAEDPRMTEAVSNNFLQNKFQEEMARGEVVMDQIFLPALSIEDADGLIELMEQWVAGMKASPDYQAMTDYASSAYTGSASFYTNPLSVFINLLNRLVQLLLSGVETLVRSALELLGKVVAGFEKMADTAIELPFISTLYRSISGGHNLSILDLVTLLIAVPVTVCYKLLHSAPPFANEGELTAFCLELDVRMGLNDGRMSPGIRISVPEFMKLTGTLSGTCFFCFTALLDTTEFYEWEEEQSLGKCMAVTALVLEFSWTAAYLPCLVEETAWQAWMLSILGAAGFSVDTYFYCTQNKHVDWDTDYGVYFTSIYGAVHLFAALLSVFTQISEIEGYEVVNAVIPCFSEMFKFLLSEKLVTGAKYVVGFLDIAAMAGLFITGLMDIVKTNDNLLKENGGIQYGNT